MTRRSLLKAEEKEDTGAWGQGYCPSQDFRAEYPQGWLAAHPATWL